MAEEKSIDSYTIKVENLVTKVDIFWKEGEFVPRYHISVANISRTTQLILEKIRREFISKVNIAMEEVSGEEGVDIIRTKFEKEIKHLIEQYFSNLDKETSDLLISYVI